MIEVSTKQMKSLAVKAGYIFGSLKSMSTTRNGFTAVIAVNPNSQNAYVIETSFQAEMEPIIEQETGEKVIVSVNNVVHHDNYVTFDFILLPSLSDDEDATQEVTIALPALGSIVRSHSGYTGQVIGYSKDSPRLLKIQWHKFGNHLDKAFDTWETPGSHPIITEPIQNQWWPAPNAPATDVINKIFDSGPFVHEIVVEKVELTADDVVVRGLLDHEANKGKPQTKATKSNGKCACGCGGMCKGRFKAGHDAKARGLLQRKMKGQEKTWEPNEDLINWVESKQSWFEDFGVFVQQFKGDQK